MDDFVARVARCRRQRIASMSAVCLVLAGCGVGPFGEVEDAPPREALEEAQAGAQRAAEEAKVAAADVQEQVERFDYEDWRDVVGDVRAAADEAFEATDKSARAAEEAAVALEDY